MGRHHAGVIFVDEKTISPADIGGLGSNLWAFVKEHATGDWTEDVCRFADVEPTHRVCRALPASPRDYNVSL